MAEGAVTAGGETHPLAPPFMVFATQNPIEQEGTYPLPEAQLDRFINRESIVGTNVVVWYAGHFTHDTAAQHDGEQGHIVGPTLSHHRW